jgi:hypothetical protein
MDSPRATARDIFLEAVAIELPEQRLFRYSRRSLVGTQTALVSGKTWEKRTETSERPRDWLDTRTRRIPIDL